MILGNIRDGVAFVVSVQYFSCRDSWFQVNIEYVLKEPLNSFTYFVSNIIMTYGRERISTSIYYTCLNIQQKLIITSVEHGQNWQTITTKARMYN